MSGKGEWDDGDNRQALDSGDRCGSWQMAVYNSIGKLGVRVSCLILIRHVN